MRSISGAWSSARKCVKKCCRWCAIRGAATGTRAMLKPLLDRLTAVESMMRAALLAAAAARRRRGPRGGRCRLVQIQATPRVLRNDLLVLNDAGDHPPSARVSGRLPRAGVRAIENGKAHFATNAAVSLALDREACARLDDYGGAVWAARYRGAHLDASLSAGSAGFRD